MPSLPQISDAEWEVMKVLWERAPLTAGEVAREVGQEQGWASRTVKTLLGRLVKKGAVAVSDEGGRFLYRAKVKREACRRKEAKSFLSRVFDGAVAPALVHLLEEGDLSKEEIAKLRRILDEEAK